MTAAERRAFATVARVLSREAQACEHHALAQELRRGAGRVEGWAMLVQQRQQARATDRRRR